ncbi:MAG: OsmC family protein [Cyanobacteriota bacterium]
MTQVSVLSQGSCWGQTVTIRHFKLVADEPPDLGGQDRGPAPFEWILAGLGSCKAMTAQMYAERKGWPLERVQVDLSLHKTAEQVELQAQLTLTGSLSPEQRQHLREIVDRCPTHRLLAGKVIIQTDLT